LKRCQHGTRRRRRWLRLLRSALQPCRKALVALGAQAGSNNGRGSDFLKHNVRLSNQTSLKMKTFAAFVTPDAFELFSTLFFTVFAPAPARNCRQKLISESCDLI